MTRHPRCVWNYNCTARRERPVSGLFDKSPCRSREYKTTNKITTFIRHTLSVVYGHAFATRVPHSSLFRYVPGLGKAFEASVVRSQVRMGPLRRSTSQLLREHPSIANKQTYCKNVRTYCLYVRLRTYKYLCHPGVPQQLRHWCVWAKKLSKPPVTAAPLRLYLGHV